MCECGWHSMYGGDMFFNFQMLLCFYLVNAYNKQQFNKSDLMKGTHRCESDQFESFNNFIDNESQHTPTCTLRNRYGAMHFRQFHLIIEVQKKSMKPFLFDK